MEDSYYQYIDCTIRLASIKIVCAQKFTRLEVSHRFNDYTLVLKQQDH